MAFDPSNVFGTKDEPRYPLDQAREYAFTEIIVYSFPVEIDLEGPGSQIAGLWQTHLATYASASGVGAVWWGYDRTEDTSSDVVLVVDWTSTAKRRAFYPAYPSTLPLSRGSQLETKVLGAVTKSLGQLFKLTEYFPSRHNAFLPAKMTWASECVSVLLTFRFSESRGASSLDTLGDAAKQRSKRDDWNDVWDVFAHTALQSYGGCISSGRAEGWKIRDPDASQGNGGEGTFLGIFRFRDLAAAQEFFDLSRPGPLKVCVEGMKAIDGDASVDVRFVEMREKLIGEK